MEENKYIYMISVLQGLTGLKSTQIAKTIGINGSLFSKWMSGERGPSRDQIEDISKALGELFSEALEDAEKYEAFTKAFPMLYKVKTLQDRARFLKNLLYFSFVSSMAPLENPMFGVRFTVTGREVLIDFLCFLLIEPNMKELEKTPFYSSIMFDKALEGADFTEFIINRQDSAPLTLHQNILFQPSKEVKLLDDYHFIYLQVLEPIFKCHFYVSFDDSIMNVMVFNDVVVIINGIETGLPVITFIKQHMISVNYRNYIRRGFERPISSYTKVKTTLDLMKLFYQGEDYYYIESNLLPSIYLDEDTIIKFTGDSFTKESIREITNLFKRAMTSVNMTMILPEGLIDQFLDDGRMTFGFYEFVVPLEERRGVLERLIEYMETYQNINFSLTTRNIQIPLSFTEKGMVDLRKDSKDRKVHQLTFGPYNEGIVRDIIEKMKSSRRHRPLEVEEVRRKISERRLDDVL